MSFEAYKDLVSRSVEVDRIQKLVLLGGEPTLHPDFTRMLRFNFDLCLKTRIYTNGGTLSQFSESELWGAKIRLGVTQAEFSGSGEKSIAEVNNPSFPISVCFMLKKDNIKELHYASWLVEARFGKDTPLMLSSIKELDKTGSFWRDTEETLSSEEYAKAVNRFLLSYTGRLRQIEICHRGAFPSRTSIPCCWFSNVFPNGKRVTCPFDISLNKYTGLPGFSCESKCQWRKEGCLLDMKSVLIARG
jgi:hypothetical protein